jgi:GWxTD domain-containing protein
MINLITVKGCSGLKDALYFLNKALILEPMIRIHLTAAIFFLLGIAFLPSKMVIAQPQAAFDRGTEELQRGNISEALDIWYSAYQNSSRVDSRIGFEFIRTVATHDLQSYYETATSLYYKALTDGTGQQSRVAIKQEIDRLEPVVGAGISRQWNQWWQNQSEILGTDMRGYWVQQDPTPSKITNERLIEHWKRITNATTQFTKNRTTIYGSDERALIYIRYGEPDRVRNGILTLQSSNIRPWLENQLRQPASASEMESAPKDMELQDAELTNRLLDAMYRYHQYPEYEIWFYENLYPTQQEPIIFLFGTDVNTNRFSLQTSLEDFIPERAYNPERERREDDEFDFTRAGITPALMLQLIYYEQLAQADPFFESRINDLKDNVLEQGLQAYQGMDLQFRSESRDLVNQKITEAPLEKSSYEDDLPQIPFQVHHYRFIDPEAGPSILTYIESSPQEALLIDYYRNREPVSTEDSLRLGSNILDQLPYYEFNHHLLTYNQDWTVDESYEQSPPVVIERNANGPVSRSFVISKHTRQNNQSASVELINLDPDSKSINSTLFSSTLRGRNKMQFRQPAPLIQHEDSLELADLVLGFQSEDTPTPPFSFMVANDQIIPFGQTLILHFEVYNLAKMSSGFTQFELTYRIFPIDEEGNLLSDQTEFILTLNFTNEETNVIEDLEIETADLGPGLYELILNITDTQTEQMKERRIRFEVLE